MLVIKGGISREIDEKNFNTYVTKGYEAIKPKKAKGEENSPTPAEKSKK